jgi:hypothetical protein
MHVQRHRTVARLVMLLIGLLAQGAHARGAHAQEPVKVADGNEPGVRMEILSLKRGEGGMVTLRVAFVNDSGGQVQNSVLPGKGNVENFALLDYGNRRKYLVVRDSGGGCLCTSLNPFKASEPGRVVLWAKFAAPPESVDHVTLLMPDAEPLDGVPLSH